MEIHEGKCPYCGSVEGPEYHGCEFLDTVVQCFWWCESCNRDITEWYDLKFVNNSKMLEEEDGNPE